MKLPTQHELLSKTRLWSKRRLILLASVAAVEPGTDREAACSIFRHLGERRTAQPASRREQRERLEHVGLARAVLADQQVEPGAAVEPARVMVAKAGEGDPVERHGWSEVGKGQAKASPKKPNPASPITGGFSQLAAKRISVNFSLTRRKRQKSAIISNWHASCNNACIGGWAAET